MTTPLCWRCGSPWFEPDPQGTLRCCDCDAEFAPSRVVVNYRADEDSGPYYFARTRPSGKPVAGVYFIFGSDRIKIGVSSNIGQRFDALQAASPVRLRLLGVEPGGRSLEAALHRRFAHCRLHGEWFRAASEILAYINKNCALT